MPHNHPLKKPEIPNLGGSLDLEIARLTVLERRKIERAGGLFAERVNELEDFERVLDIMSGTGTWTLNVAQMYPEIDVVGLERGCLLASYASGQAEACKLGNVCYLPLGEDLTKLAFSDNSFDLVNINYLFILLHPHEWPLFFQECLRITRPGGYIRVFGQDWGITNSPAIEKLAEIFLRGLKKAHLGLSPNGRYIGVLPFLNSFLRQAGWIDIQRRAMIDDYLKGAGMPNNPEQAINLMANAMRAITIQQQMATPEEFEELLAQAVIDLEREDFCSCLLTVAFCARKPPAHTV
jgi:ubiquinone/menaquinone biosynthesis C-methylase UbiE